MASLDQFLGSASLWLVGPALLLVMSASCLAGRMLRLRLDHERDSPETSDSYLLSAALGLLGLLIAFTFSLAVGRYDDRREAVIREGNALSTLWLRAGLVDGPAGHELKGAIRA